MIKSQQKKKNQVALNNNNNNKQKQNVRLQEEEEEKVDNDVEDDINDNEGDEGEAEVEEKETIEDNDHDNEGDEGEDAEKAEGEEEEEGEGEGDDEEEEDDDEQKVIKPMSAEKLKKFKEKHEKSGVIYLSRIPPFMKAQKLRHLLSQYGDVGRIFLTPEDASARRRRKKAGGNNGKKFVDGWVEFNSKKIAKAVAVSLNNTPIGGSKRNYWREDIWNIKYLKGFKWNHLTEKIAYENAVRENKIRTEMTAAKKEKDFYLQKVGQAKAITAMTNRKAKRQSESSLGGESKKGEGKEKQKEKERDKEKGEEPRKFIRTFHQRKAVEVDEL